MRLNKKQFSGMDLRECDPENARVIILPFPYEGGVSYGRGTAQGPDAIIDASGHLEFYDEVLDSEPCEAGICTLTPPDLPNDPNAMVETVYRQTQSVLDRDKFVIALGGDHSISSGFCRALFEKYGRLSVIQFDAHADLREIYEGSPFSHACVMSRIREITRETLQIGIRSLSKPEAERVRNEQIDMVMMHEFRQQSKDVAGMIQQLPDPVYITFDVDVLDWSVVRSTGTPEPSGLWWDETLELLSLIFRQKNVVGFDVVELCGNPADPNSAFAVAKLVYKMIGYNFY